MCVFVIDRNRQPLMPCTGTRARKLIRRGRAHIHRRQPCTIMLHDRLQINCQLQPLELKVDPGSRTTGLCLSRIVGTVVHVLSLKELVHQGTQISRSLTARSMMRRRSRGNLRYRKPRYLNRSKPKGWLAPSLRHRVDSTMSWVQRLSRYTPIICLAVERVKFDMQRLNNADIASVEYQRGTLYQYKVREYLLERHNRTCVYQ